MSGICGILDFNGVQYGDARINTMISSMVHRGLDGCGSAHPCPNPDIYLGHTRTSIIFPTPEASQPMTDPDTGNVLVFNGEIYNFRELQSELTQKGYAFATGSDTEVLLQAYKCWNCSCLNHLRGIFAFAIWDSQKQMLFMARDPMGVKPLYYYAHNDRLIFASEVRAILASDLVPKEIDSNGLDSMLAYGSLQSTLTLVKNVQMLPAGHYLKLNANRALQCELYRPYTLAPLTIPADDINDLIRHSLEAAVKLQMFSDVPLGIFLSGGIDSAAIAIQMAKFSSDVHAYTLHFNDAALDETQQAAQLAASLGITHHPLELRQDIVQQTFTKALDSYDQPSIDGLNTWYLTYLAHKEGLKVALSGLGGDELFIGYNGFQRPRQLMRYSKITRLIPNCLLEGISLFSRSEWFRKLLNSGECHYSPYLLTRQLFSAHTRAKLMGCKENLNPDWLKQLLLAPNIYHIPQDPINQLSAWELATYMQTTLLRDTDQMSMANALEIRAPLIDLVLLEMLLKIPGRYKINSKIPKNLLVKAADIPEAYARNPKRGFTIPLESYIKTICQEEMEELFQNPPNSLFSPKEIALAWKAYKEKKLAWQRIWCLFVTMRWIQHYLL